MPRLLIATALLIASAAAVVTILSRPPDVRKPPNASTLGKRYPNQKTEKAIFGAGCFWGTEATFRGVEGVVATAVGYTGGSLDNPTYNEVCSGRTGHAEAVEVEFDPSVVTYDQLLDVFWSDHDPTTYNRQGPDVGSQYRSAVFFHFPEQEKAAHASLARQQERRVRRVVTEIVPAAEFWRAEEYHQQYAEKHGFASCHW